jgi:hypothetical protein
MNKIEIRFLKGIKKLYVYIARILNFIENKIYKTGKKEKKRKKIQKKLKCLEKKFIKKIKKTLMKPTNFYFNQKLMAMATNFYYHWWFARVGV